MMIPTSYVCLPETSFQEIVSYKLEGAYIYPEWLADRGVILLVVYCEEGIMIVVKENSPE